MSNSQTVVIVIAGALIAVLFGASFLAGRKQRVPPRKQLGEIERQIRNRAWDAAVRSARERAHP
jgi:hypothetical protein